MADGEKGIHAYGYCFGLYNVDSKQYNEQSNGQCRHRLFDLGLN